MRFLIRDIDSAGRWDTSWGGPQKSPQPKAPISTSLPASAGPLKPWQVWEAHLRNEPESCWAPHSWVRLSVLNPFDGFSKEEVFRVLELGCGAYPIVPAFQNRFPRAQLYTLDGGNIKRTSFDEKIDWRCIPHTRAEIEYLPFADNSFRAVVGIFSFCYARRELSGPELVRILTPGGRAGLELMHPESGWFKQFDFYRLYLEYLQLRRMNIPATPEGASRAWTYWFSHCQTLAEYHRTVGNVFFDRLFDLKDSSDPAALDQGIEQLQKAISLDYDRSNLFKDKSEIQAFADACHLKVISASSYKEERGWYPNVSWTLVLEK